MIFEYDQNISVANEAKHGINFEQAQEIWNDPGAIKIKESIQSEKRDLAKGKIGDKFWTVVWTLRGQNIRIISVRRARRKEIKSYEENDNSGRI